MKVERYIVEVEMPDGDGASPLWIKDVLQSDADIEDDGRWKVSVKNGWKPSEEQMKALSNAGNSFRPFEEGHKVLWSLYNDLKKLREE